PGPLDDRLDRGGGPSARLPGRDLGTGRVNMVRRSGGDTQIAPGEGFARGHWPGPSPRQSPVLVGHLALPVAAPDQLRAPGRGVATVRPLAGTRILSRRQRSTA